MIVGVTGLQGNGKTALLAWLAEYFYKLGYEIHANFSLKRITYHHINTVEDLDKIHSGYLFLDEFWTWVDSRLSAHSEINRFVSNILMKSRKRDYALFWEAKFSHTVDRRIKEHTDYFYRPHMYVNFNGHLERIKQSILHPIKTEIYKNDMWIYVDKCFLVSKTDEDYRLVDDDDDEEIIIKLSDIIDSYDTKEEIAMITKGTNNIENGKKVEIKLSDELRKIFPEATDIKVSKNTGAYQEGLDVSMSLNGKNYIFDACTPRIRKNRSPQLDFRDKIFPEKIKTYKYTKDIAYVVYLSGDTFYAVLLTPSLAKRKFISISNLTRPIPLSKLREGFGLGDNTRPVQEQNQTIQPETAPLMPSQDCAQAANESASLSLYAENEKQKNNGGK